MRFAPNLTNTTFFMSLHFTAANLSRIRKPGIPKSTLSPIKSKSVSSNPRKKQPKKPERLEILDHNVQLDFELRGSTQIINALDTVFHNQWAEQTRFHSRYYSREAVSAAVSHSDLLFLLRGLAMETKADILKYRLQQLPTGGVLTINQLYSMFDARGNTFVDRSLEMCIREGQVHKFVISNALPVILRTGNTMSNKVTYGYENIEVVVRTDHYLSLVDEALLSSEEDTKSALDRFKLFVLRLPASLYVTSDDFGAHELSCLVQTGFITLTSNHHNEIDVHQYSISYPRCGAFLKMINAGRTWLVKTLGRSTYKEYLEEVLFEKWGKKMANFRKPFYGYDLMWVLADTLGAGVVEAFNTPVGRGWRLTGKL